MKTIVRIIKEWKNGEKTYPVGQLLNLSQENAKRLIDSGYAEKYEAEKGDVIEASPVTLEKTESLSREQILEIVTETMKKNSQFTGNATATQEEQYLKTGGFESISQFAKHVYRSTVDKRPSEMLRKWQEFSDAREKASGMSENVNMDGGFAVPVEFRNTLMSNALEASILLARTTRIPMQTNQIDIPVIEETTHATSVFGGVIVYRPGESVAVTASKPKLGKISLKLNKLAAAAYVTSELLEDSPISMEPLLAGMFAEAIGFQIDEDIINGTGVNQPLGIVNAPCLVSVAKETGQAATTIVTANILKMWARLFSRSQGNALWIANMDTFPQLATLALEVGTGGAPAGLLNVVTGATGSPQMTLLGRPLFLTEHCQTLGTLGDILCIDPSQYLVGEKAGGSIRTATSIHLKFLEDEVAFRFTVRMDGQPWMKSAVTPKNGSNTLSSFIGLATRA